MWRGWLRFGGVDVANARQFRTYVPRLARVPFHAVPADTALESMLGDWTDPVADGAPWVSPALPASRLFAGPLLLDVVGLEDATVSNREAVDAAAGGVALTGLRPGGKVVEVRAAMVGHTESAVEAGLSWLRRVLDGSQPGSQVEGGLGTLEWFAGPADVGDCVPATTGRHVVSYAYPSIGFPIELTDDAWTVDGTDLGLDCDDTTTDATVSYTQLDTDGTPDRFGESGTVVTAAVQNYRRKNDAGTMTMGAMPDLGPGFTNVAGAPTIGVVSGADVWTLDVQSAWPEQLYPQGLPVRIRFQLAAGADCSVAVGLSFDGSRMLGGTSIAPLNGPFTGVERVASDGFGNRWAYVAQGGPIGDGWYEVTVNAPAGARVAQSKVVFWWDNPATAAPAITGVSVEHSQNGWAEGGTLRWSYNGTQLIPAGTLPRIQSAAVLAAALTARDPNGVVWRANGNGTVYGNMSAAQAALYSGLDDQSGFVINKVTVTGTPKRECSIVDTIDDLADWLTAIDPHGLAWRSRGLYGVEVVASSAAQAALYGPLRTWRTFYTDPTLEAPDATIPAVYRFDDSTVDLSAAPGQMLRSLHRVGLVEGPTVVQRYETSDDGHIVVVAWQMVAEWPAIYGPRQTLLAPTRIDRHRNNWHTFANYFASWPGWRYRSIHLPAETPPSDIAVASYYVHPATSDWSWLLFGNSGEGQGVALSVKLYTGALPARNARISAYYRLPGDPPLPTPQTSGATNEIRTFYEHLRLAGRVEIADLPERSELTIDCLNRETTLVTWGGVTIEAGALVTGASGGLFDYFRIPPNVDVLLVAEVDHQEDPGVVNATDMTWSVEGAIEVAAR